MGWCFYGQNSLEQPLLYQHHKNNWSDAREGCGQPEEVLAFWILRTCLGSPRATWPATGSGYTSPISSFLPGHSQEQSLPSRSSKDGPVNSAGTRNMDHWHLQASVLQQSKLINRLIAHRTQGDSCKCLWQQQNLLGRRSFGFPLSSWGAVCPGGRFHEPACGVVAASGVNVT